MGQYQMVESNEHDKHDKHDKQDEPNNDNDNTSSNIEDLKRRSTVSEYAVSHEVRTVSGDETGSQSTKEPIVEVTKAEDTSDSAPLLRH